ncbi:MAG: efflux RND transporter permease subunit [Gammaproteobacteria bacterium]
MDRVLAVLARHPWAAILLTLLLSTAALAALLDWQTLRPRLSVDSSLQRLLPAGDDDRAVYERVQTLFGDADTVLLAVAFDPVFDAANLDAVARITDRLQAEPGVRSVVSLATVPNVLAADEAIDLGSFVSQARADPASIPALAAQFAANPVYQGSLVSADGRTALFAVALGELDEAAFRAQRLAERLRAIAVAEAPGKAVWITGSPVIQAATTQALLDTLAFMLPAIFALIVLVLGLAFRCLKTTLIAALTIGLTLLWTLALQTLLGVPMNLITAIAPPLVVTLALSYSVHVISEFFTQYADGQSPEAQRLRVLRHASLPLALCAATTVAGFMALMLSPLPAVRQFAGLAVLGVIIGIGLMLVFLPAALSLGHCGGQSAPTGQALLQKLAGRLADFDLRWRTAIISSSVVLVLIALWGASQIRTGTEYIQSFDEDSAVRRDFNAINQAFNGANLMAVLIETYVNDALMQPELIREVDAFQQWLREQPEVGGAVSYVDHLKLVNQSLNQNDPDYFSVPDSAAAAKQMLLFAGSDEIRRVVDARFRTALLSVRLNVDGSAEMADFLARAERRLAQLPPSMRAQFTGTPVLATRTVGAIAAGQWQSVLLAVVAIWIMLAFLFNSLRSGLLALLPNVVPIAVYFGLLGFTGVSLNPTTSLVACIVLGIAVDDTIHFLARFNADARATGDEQGAIRSALARTIRPVTLTSIALVLGFLVFTGSELRDQIQFGALASLTLLLAWVADLTLTPALGSRLRIVTLWDLARLDLGQSPQHTIPLLSGMSLRQARLFALTARLERATPGSLIIREGEVARDMYVILDGTVEAFVERGDGRKPLSTLGRGAVMGEAGYFGQRRTASVVARTPVRVLRFNSQDLERLRQRYPAIAATLFRNLNRIQAERIARMTAMVH